MKLSIKKRLAGILMLTLLALAVAPARIMADTLFDNLPGSGSGQLMSTVNFVAVGFTMGDNAFTLDAATLPLNVRQDAFYLSLYSDNGGKPGSSLMTLSPTVSLEPGQNGIYTDYTFTPNSPFTLSAGETYWLLGSGGGATTANGPAWQRSTSTPTINPGITYDRLAITSNGGSTWTFSTTVRVGLQLEGTVVSVPEPATGALLGVGLLGWVLRFRKISNA